ncbi:hypothetical protein [Pseudomonas sediminis]|uniref:hypothetical protein n=1 Tax=Pseudomonas sediminis TaxID=1691904 RepID=UPI0031CC3AA3
MALSSTQIHVLEQAILSYGFPLEYYDFNRTPTANPQVASSIQHLESIIYTALTSGAPADVEQGLANIIYWGNTGAGYRQHRFSSFLKKIKPLHPYGDFCSLQRAGTVSLLGIKKLGYPGYSGISFVSKVLMFLDPQNFCVLDLQISKLGVPGRSIGRALDQLKVNPTIIPISVHNEKVYDHWRDECRHISSTYYAGKYRVADVERGFFDLIRTGRLNDALEIYAVF